MFGVVLGLLVGFAIGLVVGRRQGERSAAPPVTASVIAATPITKKARKVGLTEEAFQPADDILVKMQEAWEKGEEFEPPPPPPRTAPVLAPSAVLEPSPELEEKANRVLARLEGGFDEDVEEETMPHQPAPEAAPGGDTVSEAVNELAAMGYGDDLRFDDGVLCCRQCQQTHDTKEADVEHVRRFEGESDPADEAIVLALRCPRCGAGGVLVSPYGPDADPALAEAFTYLASQAGHG